MWALKLCSVTWCRAFSHQTIANFRREDLVDPKLDGSVVTKTLRNPNVFKLW